MPGTTGIDSLGKLVTAGDSLSGDTLNVSESVIKSMKSLPASAPAGSGNGLETLSGMDLTMNTMTIAVGVLGVIVFLIIFTYLIPVRLWIEAQFAGVHVKISTLIGMRLRNVPPARIILPLITATKAGLDLNIEDLEAHYLAKGNVQLVVHALVSASKAGIELPFTMAAAIDLAGRNVLEAVKMRVTPKVIDCPDPSKGRMTVDAMAMDGIQLKVKARVTVRAHLERLVGGAGEETIIARVGEGIVSSIGSANAHKQVLENPDRISKAVMGKGLDSGTAFEILSIDIADVDVGANIGAKLQSDQAEADKQIAQAKAEGRRAMAIAQEQEMKARTQEMRAKLVEAEAQVPLAISEAFSKGNLGLMDYYRMKNIMSDTEMRDSIAKTEQLNTPEEE